MKSFASVIKRARKARGWMLDYVATRTRSHKGYISGMENSPVNPPSADLVVKLAKLFGLDEKDLLLRAEVEKAPKLIRAELKRRVFGEQSGRGLLAARRVRLARTRAEKTLRAAWGLVEEAFETLAAAGRR